MQHNYIKQASIILFTLLFMSAAMSPMILANNKSIQIFEEGSAPLDRDWYWKPSYPNYAPSGMPDFDQQQDQWKKISPGPDGILDSTVLDDDILNIDENCIAPGPDCELDSVPANDDIAEWAFCGPTAVANCFWWFDSKYADPTGTPGDGEDKFALVQDYGAGDDHAIGNVPLLIKQLASQMKTCEKGTTYISDMNDAIDQWFITTNLTNKFERNSYNRPTFDFIEEQIEMSQNVILLLGFYDFVIGDKIVDQSQLIGQYWDLLNTQVWWDYQSFIPTVDRLDAIQLFLVSNNVVGCDVEINVYNTPGGSPIATTVMNPGYLPGPIWVQFHFEPFVPLTPGMTYFFDVRQLDSNYHYEWFYAVPDVYPPGMGWMNSIPNDPYGNPFDWAFMTEYYNPPPQSVRIGGHYVTCAGVNSEEFQIGFSDPTMNVANQDPDDHNDAQYVSHDIYDVLEGSPQPDIDCQWWLPGYDAGSDYAVVEQAVVICPIPDTEPPVVTITRPLNSVYFIDTEIFAFPVPVAIGKITVEATATDADSDIAFVEFLIDEVVKANDTSAPYSWVWSERGFFKYYLRVEAYDTAGNMGFAEIGMWKLF